MIVKGYVEYKNGDKTYKYDIEGSDTSSMFEGRISSQLYEDIDFLEGGTGDALMERRFNITLGKVKVETSMMMDKEKNKEVPKPVNIDMLIEIGSLFRYVKSECLTINADNYTGLEVAGSDYLAEPIVSYTIKTPKEGTKIAKIELTKGDITRMDVETSNIKIHLEPSYEDNEYPFYAFTNAVNKPLRMTEEVLGFDLGKEFKYTPSKSSEEEGVYLTLKELFEANPHKDLTWLLDRDYEIVTDETLDEVMEYFSQFKEISMDTETTGLKITFKSRIGQGDQLVGIILCAEEGKSYYFPCQNKRFKNLCGGDHFYFMEKYMKPLLEEKEIIVHNASFDWKVCYIYDINTNITEDTMALIEITYGNEKRGFSSALKNATKIFMKRDSLELSDLIIADDFGENDITFADLPFESVRLYGNADGDNTLGLINYFRKRGVLEKFNAKKLYQIEVLFSIVTGYQEFYGHHVDNERLADLEVEVDDNMAKYYNMMKDIVGRDFNPNSSQQLVKIMYNELGIPKQYNKKTNKVTTDKKALGNVAGMKDSNDEPLYPFVSILLKYREYNTLKTNFLNSQDKFATKDGFIFTKVRQYGTTTGRVSTSDTNYQSYNDTVKKYIVGRPGFRCFDFDYSSVEYRILASMAPQPELVEAFVDPDTDYHSLQASRIYSVPYESVTKALRKQAKGINFGLPYGMGDDSLGLEIFGEKSKENTMKARELRKRYFKGQENIEKFFERVRAGGVDNGYTETYFGRRRYYYREKFSVSAIRRQAGNAVIQGTAADVYKLAVARLFLRICKEGWLGKVLFNAFVHDECFGEVHESIDPMEFLKIAREELEVKIDDFCPMYIGFGYGRSWYEAKSVEIPTRLQWELEEEYGDKGYEPWKNSTSKLCEGLADTIRYFEFRQVRDYISDPEHNGKVIKPNIYGYLTDVVEDFYTRFAEIYIKNSGEERANILKESSNPMIPVKGESEYIDLSNLVNCLEYIKSLNDSGLSAESSKKDIKGFVKKQMKKMSFEDMLHFVLKMSNTDVEELNILEPSSQVPDSNIGGLSIEDDDYDDEAENKQRAKDLAVDNLGIYIDVDDMEATLKVVHSKYMEYIKSLTNSNGVGYRIFFKDIANKKLYETQAYLDSNSAKEVRQMYLNMAKLKIS